MSHTTNGQAHRDAVAERIAETIGDGTAIDAADFKAMGYHERAKLYSVNPDRYAELSTEQIRKVAGR